MKYLADFVFKQKKYNKKKGKKLFPTQKITEENSIKNIIFAFFPWYDRCSRCLIYRYEIYHNSPHRHFVRALLSCYSAFLHQNCHWNQINFIECCNFIDKPLLKRYSDGICSRQIDRKVEIIVRSWKSNKKNRASENLWFVKNFSMFKSINRKWKWSHVIQIHLKKCVLIAQILITLISNFKCENILFSSHFIEPAIDDRDTAEC